MENKCMIPTFGNERLDKNSVVKFVKKTKTKNIDNINFSSVVTLTGVSNYGTIVGYDGSEAPENMIGCLTSDCNTSGTYFTNSTTTSASISKSISIDATLMGALTYYVYLPANGSYNISTTLFDFGTTDVTTGNGSVFVTPVSANAGAGYYVVTVDTTQVPTSIVNAGYTVSDQGFVLLSTISGLTAGQLIGWSTLEPRNSVEDLVCETVAIGTCLSSLEIGNELEYTDSVCGKKKPIKRNVTFSMEFMRKDGNIDILDQGASKKKSIEVVNQTLTKEVVAGTINGVSVGVVDLANLSNDICGNIDIILDVCVDGEKGKRLTRVCISDYAQELDNDKFVVLSSNNEASRDGKIIFSSSLVGKKVCLNIPVEKEVESYCYSEKWVDSVVSMYTSRKLSNGKMEMLFIPDLAITTNTTATSSEEEGTYTIEGDASSDPDECKLYKTII